MSQSSPSNPVVRGATVTMEDGGRLNAFATEPRMEVVEAEQGWGFHDRAEKLNGRMAMLGFIALLRFHHFHAGFGGKGVEPAAVFHGDLCTAHDGSGGRGLGHGSHR